MAYMMNWDYDGYGMMGGGFMWVYSVLVVIILVLLAVFLYQQVQKGWK